MGSPSGRLNRYQKHSRVEDHMEEKEGAAEAENGGAERGETQPRPGRQSLRMQEDVGGLRRGR